MRPAFGEETEAPSEESTPTTAKKVAAKKFAAKKAVAKKTATTEAQAEAEAEDPTTPPVKRTRRTPEQMAEARGDKPLAPAGNKAAKTALQLRREAERMTKAADAAEAREALAGARADVKTAEAIKKDLTKQLANIEKVLTKAKAVLLKLEGPGE